MEQPSTVWRILQRKTLIKLVIVLAFITLVQLLLYYLYSSYFSPHVKDLNIEGLADDDITTMTKFGINYDHNNLTGRPRILLPSKGCRDEITTTCLEGIRKQANFEQLKIIGRKNNNSNECAKLEYDPLAPEIRNFYKDMKDQPIYKPENSVSEYYRGHVPGYLNPKTNILSISDSEKSKKECVSLSYQTLSFGTDMKTKFSDETVMGRDEKVEIEDKDFVRMMCKKSDGLKYISYYTQVIRKEPSKKLSSEEKKNLFNFVFLGEDSLSKGCFLRWMPRVQKLLKQIEKEKNCPVFLFDRFNTVGDGTTDNLLGLFSKKLEEELPEAKRGIDGAQHVDTWPWIFPMLKTNGYIVGYNEENVGTGTFQYRLLGFREQPTDHYYRSLQTRPMNPEGWKTDSGHHKDYYKRDNCIRYSIEQMFETYQNHAEKQPFFTLEFSDGFHDSSKEIPQYDYYYEHLLKKWYNIGNINEENKKYTEKFENQEASLLRSPFLGDFGENTIFVFFGDHGLRYGDFRQTLYGRYEERNPLLLMIFPRSFKKSKFSNLVENIKKNQNRLVTGFDVQATIYHLLENEIDSKSKLPLPKNKDFDSGKTRMNSLLLPVPVERTCPMAGIRPQFCTCAANHKIDEKLMKKEDIYILGVQSIIAMLNEKIKSTDHDGICEELYLNKIRSVQVQLPKKHEMLSFKKGNNFDETETGYKIRTYLVNFVFTSKSGYLGYIEGIFHIHHDLINIKQMKSENVFLDVKSIKFVADGEVNRVDSYGESIKKCKKTPIPSIEKFCSCKK